MGAHLCEFVSDLDSYVLVCMLDTHRDNSLLSEPITAVICTIQRKQSFSQNVGSRCKIFLCLVVLNMYVNHISGYSFSSGTRLLQISSLVSFLLYPEFQLHPQWTCFYHHLHGTVLNSRANSIDCRLPYHVDWWNRKKRIYKMDSDWTNTDGKRKGTP